MQVGDHRESSANIVGVPGVSVNLTTDVVGMGPLALSLDQFISYEILYQMRISGPGGTVLDTFRQWIVPHIGVVKYQNADSLLEITSFAIGGGTITQDTDADSDALKDYQELFVHNTDWQIADSDDDGCDDGPEVAGGRDPLAEDPQGDLNADCALNLEDAITAMQIIAGDESGSTIDMGADVNDDLKAGFPEIIYILQGVAELR